MKNRRAFLASVASGGIGLAFAKAADPAVAQSSSPSPAPSASGKPASAAAVAAAVAMRRFDAALTDDDVQTIAKAIDANADAARTLNPKHKRLKNDDAPIVRFAVAGGEA
jgi:hypothetical protein